MLCEKCSPRELKAMRALESLTPSGSEFVNDVERCVSFVKAHHESQHKAIMNFSSRAKAAEERHERLKLLVQKLTCDVPKTEEQFNLLWNGLLPEERKILMYVLWGELIQVVKAVEEIK